MLEKLLDYLAYASLGGLAGYCAVRFVVWLADRHDQKEHDDQSNED